MKPLACLALVAASALGISACTNSKSPATPQPVIGRSAPEGASEFGAACGPEMADLVEASSASAESTSTAANASVSVDDVPDIEPEPVAVSSFAGVEFKGFRINYAASENPLHEGFRKVLAENQLFEQLVGSLNKTIRLPSTVDVQLLDCGTVNAFYDPAGKRVIVCYELFPHFTQMFQPVVKSESELGSAVIGATTFAFYHEIGHGLIDVLNLPAVGREEDNADQIATLLLMAGGDAGVGLALSGAHWFGLQADANKETIFYDEHSFDGQRFYNILCMIYGSDPDKYAHFVKNEVLPEARARRCPAEFSRIHSAWVQLLAPHMTDNAQSEISTPDTAMTPPTPPSPPPASQITCDQVTDRAIELIGLEIGSQAAKLSEAEAEELKRRAVAELPAMLEQLNASCESENWSQAYRRCIIDAASLDAAGACKPS